MSIETTLLEEVEQAVDAAELTRCDALVARLKARIAWIQELEQMRRIHAITDEEAFEWAIGAVLAVRTKNVRTCPHCGAVLAEMGGATFSRGQMAEVGQCYAVKMSDSPEEIFCMKAERRKRLEARNKSR